MGGSQQLERFYAYLHGISQSGVFEICDGLGIATEAEMGLAFVEGGRNVLDAPCAQIAYPSQHLACTLNRLHGTKPTVKSPVERRVLLIGDTVKIEPILPLVLLQQHGAQSASKEGVFRAQ